MKYIRTTPNPSGAYPPPQGHPAPGLVAITEEQAAMVVQYNGFVALTIEDEVTAVMPNTEAWEAWKASLPAEDDTAPEPEEEPSVWDELDAAYQEGYREGVNSL